MAAVSRLVLGAAVALVACTLTVNVTDSPGASTCLGRCQAARAASSASDVGLFDGIRARARGDRSETPAP